MATRAKFKCISAVRGAGGDCSYVFHPVVGGSPENDSFWKYTPSGCINLGTANEHEFVVDKEYYVDFTCASPPLVDESAGPCIDWDGASATPPTE